MADPGFTDLPGTPNFTFEFDNRLNAAASAALGASLASTVEADYALVNAWFDNLSPSGLPFNVKINPKSATRGGSNDSNKQITIDLGATADFLSAREVLIAEFIEILMAAHNKGWVAGNSHGEGLSQFAGFFIVPSTASEFSGPQTWLDTSVPPLPPPPPPPLPPSRPDFVSKTESSDKNPVSYGCALLFLYYLNSQLGFNPHAIVQAAADTLETVYKNLTQDTNGFSEFASMLAAKFPPGTKSGLDGSVNPFPLPSPRSLSLKRYLISHPLAGGTVRDRVRTLNVGNLRAVMNSDRRVSELATVA
jgi:hypothetical protein